MNAKNKKLLAIVGVAAVLLIVIGVSVSMLGKGDQPSEMCIRDRSTLSPVFPMTPSRTTIRSGFWSLP